MTAQAAHLILHWPLVVALLSPLMAALLLGFFWRPRSVVWAGGVASAAVGLSFVCVLILFGGYFLIRQPWTLPLFAWMVSGDVEILLAFDVNALSLLMGAIVTGIGGIIHVYAIGYMADDETPYRFFAYLNLFVVAMLVLVFAANLPVMFIGWEGVGLCSYLLIGYGYRDISNTIAGMKAFVVNRIGDLGFLLGMFGVFSIFGSLDFDRIMAMISAHTVVTETSWGVLHWTALGLFLGAVGKSAQIPLYVWLPDAMAGPTPVSALIHAATMVTAGLVMMARMGPFFDLVPMVQDIVLWVGALTALFAAVIAMAQTDIKKVLAYSTVSQLGYMFSAMGVGAYGIGMFHVFTHAFFKALLFLGAGSVIVALHHEQDMRKMGGLRAHLPVPFWVMLVGTFALAGVFPFAGFFSKDEILLSVFGHGHGVSVPYIFLVVAAFLTAFYMTRLMALTFGGQFRGGNLPHHGISIMQIPLIILAVGSATVGFLGWPHFLGGHPIFGDFLAGFMGHVSHGNPGQAALLAGISLGVACFGIASGYYLYVMRPHLPWQIATTFRRIHTGMVHKFYVDEIYDVVFVRPVVAISQWLWQIIDVRIIDGSVNGLASMMRTVGVRVAQIQTGHLQTYGLFLLIGSVVLLLLFLRRMGIW